MKPSPVIEKHAVGADEMGLDEVRGHIHHPESSFGGIHYINDGDWIENCSALSEDVNGNLSLIHYLDSLESATVTPITTKTSRSEAA